MKLRDTRHVGGPTALPLRCAKSQLTQSSEPRWILVVDATAFNFIFSQGFSVRVIMELGFLPNSLDSLS